MGENSIYDYSESTFSKTIKRMLQVENIWASNAYDPFNCTKFGITKKTALENGFDGDMEEFEYWRAKEIYRKKFWMPNNLDEVDKCSPMIASHIFEASVRCGNKKVAEWFQESLNLVSDDFIAVNGVICDQVIKVLSRIDSIDKKTTISKMINVRHGMHYIESCKNDVRKKEFINAWFRRVR